MLMYGVSPLDTEKVDGKVGERATIFIVTRMSIKARNSPGKSLLLRKLRRSLGVVSSLAGSPGDSSHREIRRRRFI